MNLFFAYLLFTCFITALFWSVSYIAGPYRKYTENRLFSLLCLVSAVWSFGFFGVLIQTDPEKAHYFRIIGMLGVFSYFTVIQILICKLGQIKKTYLHSILAVTILGYLICFFITRKGQVTYTLSPIGMTYKFNPGIWHVIYIIYCLVIATNIISSIIYVMLHAARSRIRVMAKRLLFVVIIIMLGMILDTIFPLLGMTTLPGSTIGQFIALIAMNQTLHFANKFQITIDNMSTYVYYSLTSPVLVYDSNYNLQILNDATLDFTGLVASDLKASGIDKIFTIEPEDAFVFHGNRKDIDVVCHYNQLNCNLSISKIHDDYYDVIGYIIIVTDLSERMESIGRLEEAIAEAESANQAKTTFLANMSHEIRTPMNAIIGFTELVLREDISPKIREYMNGIHLSSRNLLAIINDILDITKIESGKMKLVPCDYYFSDLLEDVSLIISQQATQKGLEFIIRHDENIPSQLYGDKIRIRGVLINILNNAVKYTREGTVTFEIHIVSRSEENVRFSFIIRDTGIGIRPEDQERLFQSFERLDPKVHYGIEGSGLGLSIAKGYLNLMDGDIKVESEYGAGSVFTVTIDQKIVDATPMQHNLTINSLDTQPKECALSIHDTRVLLVDDNHINLMVIQALLESYGLMVDTASSGAASIDICKTTHYPLIFMDQMMPDIDGIEAMQQIRKLDSYYAMGGESKIIVLTADAIRGSRETLLAKGFDEYLGKPINLKQLERVFTLFLPEDKLTITSPAPSLEAEPDSRRADSEEIRYLKENLPELDITMGLNNCGGSLSDYLNVLKINYTHGDRQLADLEKMLQEKDYENYTIKVHSLKSTTLGIGAVNISNLALEQEKAGKNGEYDYIDSHFEALKADYSSLLIQLQQVLSHYGLLAEAPAQNGEPLDSQAFINILTDIRTQVDNFDFSTVFDILEETKKLALSPAHSEVFKQLDSLMENLEVDEVRSLIDKTITQPA